MAIRIGWSTAGFIVFLLRLHQNPSVLGGACLVSVYFTVASSIRVFPGSSQTMMMAAQFFEHELIAAHAAIEPLGNTRDGSRAQTRFFHNLVVRDFVIKHLSGSPAAGKFV